MKSRWHMLATAGIVALVSASPIPAHAQRTNQLPLGLQQPARSATPVYGSAAVDSVRPNQWRKGMTIGAGIGAVLGVAVYALEHSYDDTRTSPFVIIGPIVIFSLIGGLIGASYPKN